MREGDEIIGPEMEEQKPEPSVPLKDVRSMLDEIRSEMIDRYQERSVMDIAKKHLGVDLE